MLMPMMMMLQPRLTTCMCLLPPPPPLTLCLCECGLQGIIMIIMEEGHTIFLLHGMLSWDLTLRGCTKHTRCLPTKWAMHLLAIVLPFLHTNSNCKFYFCLYVVPNSSRFKLMYLLLYLASTDIVINSYKRREKTTFGMRSWHALFKFTWQKVKDVTDSDIMSSKRVYAEGERERSQSPSKEKKKTFLRQSKLPTFLGHVGKV